MNRAFKIEFHNGAEDEKPIVTMSLTVDNGSKFKKLDTEGYKSLYVTILSFKRQLDGFMEDVMKKSIEKN
jgi:hypothetical protein